MSHYVIDCRLSSLTPSSHWFEQGKQLLCSIVCCHDGNGVLSVCVHSFCVGTRRVCLVVDRREKQRGRLLELARSRGLAAQERQLPVGDYLWLLLPPGAPLTYDRIIPKMEAVRGLLFFCSASVSYCDKLKCLYHCLSVCKYCLYILSLSILFKY